MQSFGEGAQLPSHVSPLVNQIYDSAAPLRTGGGNPAPQSGFGSWLFIGLALLAALVVVGFLVYNYFYSSKGKVEQQRRSSLRRMEEGEAEEGYEGGETENKGRNTREKPPPAGYQYRAPIGGGGSEYQPQQRRLGEARTITAPIEGQQPRQTGYVEEQAPPPAAAATTKKVRFAVEEDPPQEGVEKKLMTRKSEGRTLRGAFEPQQSPSTAKASRSLVMTS